MIEHVGERPRAVYAEIADGEEDPFGEAGMDIRWRDKEWFTLLRDERGRAIASVGLTLADVEVGAERFEVVGVGGVIVTHSRRGEGHLRTALGAALERAGTLGPDKAMLFCGPWNVALYARFGFVEVAAPVVAGGQEMPDPALWRPLKPGATWPEGPVNLPQLPF